MSMEATKNFIRGDVFRKHPRYKYSEKEWPRICRTVFTVFLVTSYDQ